jgi:hypothetical protein
LPITVLMLGGYLGVAYITRETQGFYRELFFLPFFRPSPPGITVTPLPSSFFHS